MVIIIEGLDGVGKTTFCKKFCEITNFIYVKGSYTNDLEEKKRRMTDLLTRILDDKNNYIYDRITLVDDFAYSILNKSKNELDEYFDIIQSLLNRCKIYHLQVDESIRRERFDNRGDDYVTNDMLINDVSKGYEEYYDKLGKDKVRFFTLSFNNDENVAKILEELDHENISYSKQ